MSFNLVIISVNLSHIAIFNKKRLYLQTLSGLVNCSKDLPRHVIFCENRDIAINNVKDSSDNKIGDKKNLLTNFIFLKIVINNIYNACGANHFTRRINIISTIYSQKKRFFCHVLFELQAFWQSTPYDNQPRSPLLTICLSILYNYFDSSTIQFLSM